MLEFLKKPSTIGFIIALLMVIVVMWFYFSQIENKNYIVIDNPLDEVIKVEIDQNKYSVAPFQTVRISLNKGTHYISAYKNDSLLSKGKFINEKDVRGLINPTLSEYAIYKRYYAKGVNQDSLLRSYPNIVDSVTYYGELRRTDSLYIKGFYLNVDQDFPTIIKNMDTISAIPKIFRWENFKKYYQKNMN